MFDVEYQPRPPIEGEALDEMREKLKAIAKRASTHTARIPLSSTKTKGKVLMQQLIYVAELENLPLNVQKTRSHILLSFPCRAAKTKLTEIKSAILSTLEADRRPHTKDELVARIGFPKPNLERAVRSLVKEGKICVDESGNRVAGIDVPTADPCHPPQLRAIS